jgi:2-polyprenyl-3-methyl-5-hydroxy-6-metoxy-1,4-benzoquinol methylase
MAMLAKEKLENLSFKGYFSMRQRLLSLAPRKEGGSFLDIGCHHGIFTTELGRHIGAKKLYGLDIDRRAISVARSKGIEVKKVDLDKKNIPFHKKSFDVILCNQVIEHLTDPDKLLEEIHRVLKDDGYAIISTPNLASLHNRLLLLIGSQPTTIAPSTRIVFGNPLRGADSRMRGPARHIAAFTHKSLREMIRHYGFEIEKYAGSGFYPFRGWVAEGLAKMFPNFAVYSIIRIRKK